MYIHVYMQNTCTKSTIHSCTLDIDIFGLMLYIAATGIHLLPGRFLFGGSSKLILWTQVDSKFET